MPKRLTDLPATFRCLVCSTERVWGDLTPCPGCDEFLRARFPEPPKANPPPVEQPCE